MSKLYIGSLGTLGIFTQCNFKTFPAPENSRVLIFRLPEGTRSRAIAHVATLEILPSVAAATRGFRKAVDGEDGIDGRVFLMFEGSSALIERATRETRSALGRAGVPETIIVDHGAREAFTRLLDAYTACVGERSITYRSYGLPDDLEMRVEKMHAVANEYRLHAESIADIMNGDVTLRVSERDTRSFAQRIELFDDALHAVVPNASVIAGPAPLRGMLDVWGELPPAIDKMRRLKARFDPKAILNAGRFIGDPACVPAGIAH